MEMEAESDGTDSVFEYLMGLAACLRDIHREITESGCATLLLPLLEASWTATASEIMLREGRANELGPPPVTRPESPLDDSEELGNCGTIAARTTHSLKYLEVEAAGHGLAHIASLLRLTRGVARQYQLLAAGTFSPPRTGQDARLLN